MIKQKIRKHFLLSLVWLIGVGVFFAPNSYAHNSRITNVSIASQDTTANTVTIQFDIMWKNSWRDSTNMDAIWIFVKYSLDAGINWGHATLKGTGTNPSGFDPGSSSASGGAKEFVVPSDSKGCFLRQATVTASSPVHTEATVKIVWDYGTDGLSDAQAGDISTFLHVYGIEMVNIPTASFYIGDGTNNASSPPGGFFNASSGTYAYLQITSEGALTLGGSTSGFVMSRTGMSTQDDFTAVSTKSLPAAFPKGYAAFYQMKYEISEEEYVAFLNNLGRTQQHNRVAATVNADTITNVYVMSNSTTVSYRNNVRAPASGNGTTLPIIFTTDRPWRACGFLSWMDVVAFLDWAALRPMTDLEYEKSARGPSTPVSLEYVWGEVTAGTFYISSFTNICTGCSETTAIEQPGTVYDKINYNNTTFTNGDGGIGPVRTGLFASQTTGTSFGARTAAGAGYYGTLELSGNVHEWIATVGHATGRAFTGTHGNGALTTESTYEGNATNTDWPGIDGTAARGVTGADGSGVRGGSFADAANYIQLSSRISASSINGSRSQHFGGRGVRTE